MATLASTPTGATPGDRLISEELLAAEVDVERITALAVSRLAEQAEVDAAWVVRVDLRRSRAIAASADAREPGSLDPVDYERLIGEPADGVLAAGSLGDHPLGQIAAELLGEGGEDWLAFSLLRCGSEQLGVLAAAGRGDGPTSETRRQLSELAVQASLAIRTDRIQEHLARQSASLERTFDAHRRLHEAAAGGDFVGVVEELSAVLGRGLSLVQSEAEPERLTVGANGTAAAGEIEIVLGRRRIGSLCAYGRKSLGRVEDNLLREGADLITLALAKQQQVSELEWKLRGDLLEELLESPSSAAASARAGRLGIDLGEPHRVLAVEFRSLAVEPATLVRALTGSRLSERSGVLVSEKANRIVVGVIGDPERSQLIGERLIEVAGAGSGIAIGISSTRAEDFESSLREALSCARFALRGGTASAIVEHASLGPLRFMLDAPDIESSAALVQEVLGPLASYDAQREGGLMETLRVFLEENGRHAPVAARCHIHLSTVKYRLARIAELLDCDLGDADTRFRLWLCVRLRDLFGLVGTDLLSPAPALTPPAGLSAADR